MTIQTSLQHNLNPHFPALSQVKNSKELKSLKLYQDLYEEIQTVLRGYETGFFAPQDLPAKAFYRVVNWNLERGIEFEGILHSLKNHPILKEGDVFILPETDLGMIRSGNRNVARELAEALGLNYYFVPTYINLCKGNGAENHFEGDNTLAIHGNAILSRYPMKDFHPIPLHNNKDKMKGGEKRLGHQQALCCTVLFPQKEVRIIGAHLDAHSTKKHRCEQMRMIMDYTSKLPHLPSIFGGDLNTMTYDSNNAFWAIYGFWVRVAMGVRYVIANHYPHPDRLFEKKLFKTLEKHGYNYKDWNEPGACTLHYSVEDLKKIKNLRDIIPEWCFKFIDWALSKNNGRCSFKIDWFAGKEIQLVDSQAFAGAIAPQVVDGLSYQGQACSDHDAIVADFSLG